MNLSEFKSSLSSDIPPSGISEYLKALWYDAKGDWEKSHNIVQDIHTRTGSWIHAYLHRKEGDIGNADYWYNLAGRKRPSVTPGQEWEEIAGEVVSL